MKKSSEELINKNRDLSIRGAGEQEKLDRLRE